VAWLVAALVVALAAAPGALWAQITVDHSSSATANASTLTWAHTIGSGSDRVLVVGVSIRNAGRQVSGVTYGGAPLTFIGARNNHDNTVRTEMWFQTAPTVGTANVVVTLTRSARMVGGAVSFFGVSASAPLGTFVANNSTDNGTDDPSVVVTSAAGEMIVSALSTQGSAGTVTPLAGQTQRWNRFYGTGGGDAAGFGSTAPGAASVTMGWTKTGTARWAIGAVPLQPALTTTLANGTDPADASLAPGGVATVADAFTLQTNLRTDAITAVTVALAVGTSGGLGLVEITNDAGTLVYGSVADPASDTPAITLATTITATTTATQYRIRVTAKSHGAMPAPPGSTYSVTARISDWTGTNAHAGSDAAGTTVTIDNLSPEDVTGATATAAEGQVSLSWTNPGDADLGSIVVLRRTTTEVTDVPAEGSTYAVGNMIGASTVACVVTAPTAACTDTGLSNGTAYYYQVFARDANGNYATGATPTGSPATPEVAPICYSAPGGDRVVFQAFTEASSAVNVSSITVPTTCGASAGDLLVVAVATDGNTTASLSPPAGEGWNLIDLGSRFTNGTLGVWWKLAGPAEPATHQFTWTGGEEVYAWMMRFTGHDPAAPIEAWSAADMGNSTSPLSPSVTTTVDSTLIVRLGVFDDDDITVDAPGLPGHTAITMDRSGFGYGTVSGGAGYVPQPSAGASGTSDFALTAAEQSRMVTIAIKPASLRSVSVTPDGGQNLHQLPSNGANYSFSFTVTNTGGIASDFGLKAFARPGTALGVVAVNGVGGDTTNVTLAAGASQAIAVEYTVGVLASGTPDSLWLRPTAGTAMDTGFADLIVVRPLLQITRSVAPIGVQPPGTDLTYGVTVTNVGTREAVHAVAVDSLAPSLQFKVGTVESTLPPGVDVTVEYSNDGGASWTYVPAPPGCGAPAGYDGCVDRIRWTLLSDLGAVAPDNTGTFRYVARIK
jgi:uncharacterized repeat protein (TIGR01451 family)